MEKGFLYSKQFGKILFSWSLITLLFWSTAIVIDVYQSPILAAIFEMAWLAMLLSLVVIPIVSLMILLKQGISLTSYVFYALLMIVGAIVVILKNR